MRPQGKRGVFAGEVRCRRTIGSRRRCAAALLMGYYGSKSMSNVFSPFLTSNLSGEFM
jgi:hypothetical protein